MDENRLDELVAAVRAGAHYRTVSEELIRRIGAHELAVRRNLKAAVKETKSRLHQVAGAYLERRTDYAGWATAIEAAGDDVQLRAACLPALHAHASTRERLPFLDSFYRTLFGALPPVGVLLDVACGHNPLSAPWMGLTPGAAYYACDLYADMVAFLGHCLNTMGYSGGAEVRDVIGAPPPQHADVAFVFKTLPVLEQIRRGAGRELLSALNTRHILVSFPVTSLGGRTCGMSANYAASFGALADAEGWNTQRFDFAGELVFLVEKT